MESAIRTVKPFVGENTLFLSVLNGISSEGMIEEAYGAPYSLIQKEGEARTMMIEAMREAVAETDDALMEKFFGGGHFLLAEPSCNPESGWTYVHVPGRARGTADGGGAVCGDDVKDRGGRGTFSSGERVFV